MKYKLLLSNLLFSCLLFSIGSAQEWEFVYATEHPNGLQDVNFGYDVDISDNYAIVGAREENGDSTNLVSAGAAYIYRRVGETWQMQQRIVPELQKAMVCFGYSVAINDNFAIVGALFENAAYIFRNVNDEWIQVNRLIGPDQEGYEWFGISVAISANFAIVGSYYDDKDENGQNHLEFAGSAYIFKNNNGNWEFNQKIVASDRIGGQWFGAILDITDQFAVVGTVFERRDENSLNSIQGAGAAYIYSNTNNNWSQVQKIVASDRSQFAAFGGSASVYGNTVVIGSEKNYQTYVFDYSDGFWTQTQFIQSEASQSDGESLVSIYGDKLLINYYGLYREAHFYARVDGVWYPSQLLIPDGSQYTYLRYACSLSAYNAIFSGKQEPEKDMVLISFDRSNSSVEQETQQNFRFSPNPVSGTLFITAPETQYQKYQLKIFNAFGEIVYQNPIVLHETQIDMSKLFSGVYIVETSSGLIKKYWKFVKI